MDIHRHSDSWIPMGELGSRFPDYRPTFGDQPFVSENHAALAAAPMDGWLIDVGITGWLRRADGLKLYELAYRAEGDVLEIGCAFGLSSWIIAGAIRDGQRPASLLSIDLEPERTEAARRVLDAHGLAVGVEFRAGDASEICPALVAEGRRFGFVFVDHSHAYGPVLDVCRTLLDLVADGGFVLFHDFNDAHNDNPRKRNYNVPQAVADGLPADRFAFYGVYGCTALYRKTSPKGEPIGAGIDVSTSNSAIATTSR